MFVNARGAGVLGLPTSAIFESMNQIPDYTLSHQQELHLFEL
jgi:hypothetical protein